MCSISRACGCPLGLPAGLTALLVGTALGWGIKGLSLSPLFAMLSPGIQQEIGFEVALMPTAQAVRDALHPGFFPPILAIGDLIEGLKRPEILGFMGIIIPMGLFNVIGSLQNIESAEAEGDRFPTMPSLAVNGIGSIVAALFWLVLPDDHLHRSRRLEAAGRANRLLGAQRHRHLRSLRERA